jgi:hypothetical protein
MNTHKTGTGNVSGASDLGSMYIAFGTAGNVNCSMKLSIPSQVENAAAVADMHATVHPELVGTPESKLEAPLTALPAAPALTNEFTQLVELTKGTLEARKGTHSAYEFRLTLKDVQPGQTQKTLEALVAEMNSRFGKMPNHPSCGFKVYLSQNGDLPNYEKAGSVVFTCSSLIYDSTERHREVTTTRKGEERSCQEALLSAHGLVQVPNDVVRAVAGMYRLAHGFPDSAAKIGKEHDQGDVFEGKVARTKRGISGSAASYQHGVSALRWHGYVSASVSVGVVGGLSPELK